MFESYNEQIGISGMESSFKLFYWKCQTNFSKIEIIAVGFHDKFWISVKTYLNSKTRVLECILIQKINNA